MTKGRETLLLRVFQFGEKTLAVAINRGKVVVKEYNARWSEDGYHLNRHDERLIGHEMVDYVLDKSRQAEERGNAQLEDNALAYDKLGFDDGGLGYVYYGNGAISNRVCIIGILRDDNVFPITIDERGGLSARWEFPLHGETSAQAVLHTITTRSTREGCEWMDEFVGHRNNLLYGDWRGKEWVEKHPITPTTEEEEGSL